MLPVPPTVRLVTDTCPVDTERTGPGRIVSTMHTSRGDLRQVTETREGFPSLTTERYLKTSDDALKLTEYYASLRVEPVSAAVADVRRVRELAGDRGVVFCRTFGTPLGMCYRVYASIVDLLYLIADDPGIAADLFACMEEKYLGAYRLMLRDAPEIDAFLGMDDTSTTLISPEMFDRYNVALTNQRADLCRSHGRIYVHHSCGLIRNLLPVYRKTRMAGVDAFTPPPIGDVEYSEGRRLLGPEYSMITSLAGGIEAMDEASIHTRIAERFEDARAAGNAILQVGGSHLTFPAMELIMSQALAMQAESR